MRSVAPGEITDTRVVIETRRKGHVEPIRHTWTIEMARRARLKLAALSNRGVMIFEED